MRDHHPFRLKRKADGNHLHEVIFHIKQLNLGRLQKIVDERSSPDHPNYQNWLSFTEIGVLTANFEGAHRVMDYLTLHSVQVWPDMLSL